MKFDTFFDCVQAFINRNVLEVVDEREHEQAHSRGLGNFCS